MRKLPVIIISLIFFIVFFLVPRINSVSACGECQVVTGGHYETWCGWYDQRVCVDEQWDICGTYACRRCEWDWDENDQRFRYCYDDTCNRWCVTGCNRWETEQTWGCEDRWYEDCGTAPNGASCSGGQCVGGSCLSQADINAMNQVGVPTPTPTPEPASAPVQNANNCDLATQGEVCPNNVTQCYPTCSSYDRCCVENTSYVGECTTDSDCPDKSKESQCGSAACFVQKSCSARGTCEYGCITGPDPNNPGGCFLPAPAPAPGETPAPAPTAPPGCNPNAWGDWSACSGSPATKSRANACATVETVPCTGTIRSRAAIVSAGASCDDIRASAAPLTSTVHQFTAGSASQPAAQTQTDNNYVTFSNIVGGTYTLAPSAPNNYALSRSCWSRVTDSPTSGEGLTTTVSVPTDGDSLTWDLGYGLVGPWTQTKEGNVLSGGNIKSLIPAGTSPRSFNLSGAGGYPGAVFYGTGYDFDSDYAGTGETLVSGTNWLVNQTFPMIDYYTYYYVKLGGPITADSFPNPDAVPKPASRVKPYYAIGNITTSGNWSVGDGESLIFLVNGNLTIGGSITTTGTGFIAFIVKGDITVSSEVGGIYTSSTPAIEGLYITSNTGTLKTGTSSIPGKERLVLRGTFVSGSFSLQRDLTSVNANPTTAAELFIYDPSLPFRMPDSLRDVPIVWQEVAP